MLKFEICGETLKNADLRTTLNLHSQENKYNYAVTLLTDENQFPGVNIVTFGEHINIIPKKATFEHMSILKIYEHTVQI